MLIKFGLLYENDDEEMKSKDDSFPFMTQHGLSLQKSHPKTGKFLNYCRHCMNVAVDVLGVNSCKA